VARGVAFPPFWSTDISRDGPPPITTHRYGTTTVARGNGASDVFALRALRVRDYLARPSAFEQQVGAKPPSPAAGHPATYARRPHLCNSISANALTATHGGRRPPAGFYLQLAWATTTSPPTLLPENVVSFLTPPQHPQRNQASVCSISVWTDVYLTASVGRQLFLCCPWWRSVEFRRYGHPVWRTLLVRSDMVRWDVSTGGFGIRCVTFATPRATHVWTSLGRFGAAGWRCTFNRRHSSL